MKKIVLQLLLILCSANCLAQSCYVSQSTKKIVFSRDGGMYKADNEMKLFIGENFDK